MVGKGASTQHEGGDFGTRLCGFTVKRRGQVGGG